jgi:hypothetical protein
MKLFWDPHEAAFLEKRAKISSHLSLHTDRTAVISAVLARLERLESNWSVVYGYSRPKPQDGVCKFNISARLDLLAGTVLV